MAGSRVYEYPDYTVRAFRVLRTFDAEVQRAAAREGVNVSEYIRRALLRALHAPRLSK